MKLPTQLNNIKTGNHQEEQQKNQPTTSSKAHMYHVVTFGAADSWSSYQTVEQESE